MNGGYTICGCRSWSLGTCRCFNVSLQHADVVSLERGISTWLAVVPAWHQLCLCVPSDDSLPSHIRVSLASSLSTQVPTEPKVLARLGALCVSENDQATAFHNYLEVGGQRQRQRQRHVVHLNTAAMWLVIMTWAVTVIMTAIGVHF